MNYWVTTEDFVCLFVSETDERFTYSSNMFLYFAHNVVRFLKNELYLGVNVFSASVCSHLQGKALPSFPVVLRFRVLI